MHAKLFWPIVMHGCESWAIKKAEHWRIDAFELWCWRRLLRVPWTERRTNQSVLRKSTLNIHWKDWCWSWSSSTLANWYEELSHWKRPWCWERLRAGGEGDDRMRWLDGITDSMDLSWSKLRGDGKGRGRQAWCAAAQGVSNSQTWLRDWTARWRMQWGSTEGVTECWARRGKLLGYAFTQDSEFVSATQSFFWMIGTSVDGRWGVVKRR